VFKQVLKQRLSWLLSCTVVTATLSFSGANSAYAEESGEELSLESILDIKITTASKKAESLFNSPLSASAITRKDIVQAGVTTLAEAFRLVPGLIVRENSNGNYDVSIRGAQGINNGEFAGFNAEMATLVMIDNRPVYSYFGGGTIWESLPISLNDVDRIEVVRGPAAALYGPNAVNGVINIITNRANKKGWNVVGDGFLGTSVTRQGGLSAYYNGDDKMKFGITANSATRNRQKTEYYDHKLGKFQTTPEAVQNGGAFFNPTERYPVDKRDLAFQQNAINAFGIYKLTDDIAFDVSAGYQKSFSQKLYFENLHTPNSMTDMNSQYVDAKAKAHGATLQVSYLSGNTNVLGLKDYQSNSFNPVTGVRLYDGANALDSNVGNGGTIPDKYNFNIKFSTLDANLEYDHQVNNLNIRPGVVYRKAIYDSSYIAGAQQLNSIGGTIRLDYKMDDWRFIGAARLDRYQGVPQTGANIDFDPYASWQGVINKSFGDNHLTRLVYSRANLFPTMTMTFLDLTLNTAVALGGSLPPYGVTRIDFKSQLKTMQVNDMLEFGHRWKINQATSLDTEAFLVFIKNSPGMLYNQGTASATGLFGTIPQITVPITFNGSVKADATQMGLTSSLTFRPSHDLTLQAYATLQNLTRYDFQTDTSTGALVLDAKGQPTRLPGVRSAFTPQLTGGFVANYKFMQKFNVNLNGYFYSAQTYTGIPSDFVGDRTKADLSAYVISSTGAAAVEAAGSATAGAAIAQAVLVAANTSGATATTIVTAGTTAGATAGMSVAAAQAAATAAATAYGAAKVKQQTDFVTSKGYNKYEIQPQLLLNARVGYEVYKGVEVFANVRQALSMLNSSTDSNGSNIRQNGWTDQISALALVGINAEI